MAVSPEEHGEQSRGSIDCCGREGSPLNPSALGGMSQPSTQQQRRSLTVPPAGSGTSGGSGAASGSNSRQQSLQRWGSGATLPSPGRLGAVHSRAASLTSLDNAAYAASQELASVLNAPSGATAAASSSWLMGWPFAQGEDYDAPPPPLPPGTLPEVRVVRMHPRIAPGLCRPPHSANHRRHSTALDA